MTTLPDAVASLRRVRQRLMSDLDDDLVDVLAAAGVRFLLSNRPALAIKEIGATLNATLGDAAKHVPSRSITDLVLRASD